MWCFCRKPLLTLLHLHPGYATESAGSITADLDTTMYATSTHLSSPSNPSSMIHADAPQWSLDMAEWTRYNASPLDTSVTDRAAHAYSYPPQDLTNFARTPASGVGAGVTGYPITQYYNAPDVPAQQHYFPPNVASAADCSTPLDLSAMFLTFPQSSSTAYPPSFCGQRR